ncbi:metal-dependent hydrolase [Haladaptatus sp. DFWS20]|uniref:metal-dependent hydrolase n=1 Tax=Haladaptatus sp. DFWS20 TaxID=3403467 RepID=UPI003EBDA877
MFGYLAYSLVVHVARGRAPSGSEVGILVVATQLPDIVDKPLAWTFHILPSGRSLAHSTLTATIGITLVAIYCRRTGREGALAFGVGYISHLVGDIYRPVMTGEYADIAFVLWPVLPVAPDTEPSFVAHFEAVLSTGITVTGLVLTVIAVLMWITDGRPGLSKSANKILRFGR